MREVPFSATLHEPLHEAVSSPREVVLNRRVRIGDPSDDAPHARGRVAWVVDPVRGTELPYWIDAAEEEAIARGRVPSSRTLRQSLVSAGILHDPAATAIERRRLARTMRASRARLVSRGFMALHDLLPPMFVAALRRYFRTLVDEGHLPFGDGQSSRYFRHDEPLAVWLHRRLAPLVGRAIAHPVKPSYSYLVSYRAGAVLDRHNDRLQCEYTLSLSIDATPDATREQAWPLCLEPGPNRVARVLLAPGDGLLFRGRELVHFRDELGPGRTATSLLLHFVHEDFDGPLS